MATPETATQHTKAPEARNFHVEGKLKSGPAAQAAFNFAYGCATIDWRTAGIPEAERLNYARLMMDMMQKYPDSEHIQYWGLAMLLKVHPMPAT